MRYFEIVKDGVILGAGKGNLGDEITSERYDNIMAAIPQKPKPHDDVDYRLLENLTWEAYELPPQPAPEPTADDKAEAYDILMGVSE